MNQPKQYRALQNLLAVMLLAQRLRQKLFERETWTKTA
jgi:hypothetical protein